MSEVNVTRHEFDRILAGARAILERRGRAAASDTSQVLCTEGDLNISSDDGVIEIIYRGTLVFRYDPGKPSQDSSFDKQGDWLRELEQVERDLRL